MLFCLLVISCPGPGPDSDSPPDNEPPVEEEDLINDTIPEQAYNPLFEDFSLDHPDIPGIYISYNTVMLAFKLGTTVDQANQVLDDANAEIVGGIPGDAGENPGILIVKTDSQSHEEMETIIDQMMASGYILGVVRDALMGLDRVFYTAGNVAGWSWEAVPQGGNWGHELVRIPQVWNLYQAISKYQGQVSIGILDGGFFAEHEDLDFNEIQSLGPGVRHDHGTYVAGIIGATPGNSFGIDGINGHTTLIGRVLAPLRENTVDEILVSSCDVLVSGLYNLLCSRPDIRVVNISAGYPWGDCHIDPSNSPDAQDLVYEQAQLFLRVQYLLRDHFPLLVVSAGNDSNDGMGPIDAMWNSPFSYSALADGNPNVLVVESIANDPAASGGGRRSVFSNIWGSVSAPGQNILSCSWDENTPEDKTLYDYESGTSVAAPYVTGVASLLIGLDPALTNQEISDLLMNSAVPVADGASGRIDAFAAALDIDSLRGNSNVLKMLLDIDDGSIDGNLRYDLAGDFEVIGEDMDGDGGIGDGNIDMSDFRRFRDWLLQVEAWPDLMLNGRADHPKKDLNLDGVFGAAASENVYPMGDFNGDGRLNRDDNFPVAGIADREMTDLDMLALLFEDPNYEVEDLYGLLDSADLLVDAGPGLSEDGVARITIKLFVPGEEDPFVTRIHEDDSAVQMYTEVTRAEGYIVRAEALDAGGVLVGTDELLVPFNRGQDNYWAPDCTSGRTEWRYYIGQNVRTSVAIDPVDGTIYVASDDFYALYPNGTRKWLFELCGVANSSPTVDPFSGRIYFGLWTADRAHLYAVEPWGDLAWMFQTELFTGASIHSSPAISPGPDTRIYFTAQDDYLYCVGSSGLREWRITVPSCPYIPVSSPVLTSDSSVLYVGGGDGNLYAIDTTAFEGAVIGYYPTGGVIQSTPAIGEDGVIYVGSNDNCLHAVSPAGEGLWTFETGYDVVSSPAIGEDGTIYVGSEDRNLYAINPDGTEKWHFETGGPIVSSPAVGADGTIYIGSNDSNVYAIYPDGNIKWKLDGRNGWSGMNFEGPITLSDDNKVYAGGSDGNLYAIENDADIPGLALSPWPKFQHDTINSGREEE